MQIWFQENKYLSFGGVKNVVNYLLKNFFKIGQN